MHYILYTEVGMFVGLTVRNTASTGSGASDVKLLAAGECRRISEAASSASKASKYSFCLIPEVPQIMRNFVLPGVTERDNVFSLLRSSGARMEGILPSSFLFMFCMRPFI